MFATQYYCLVASLKEYALDADTKGFDARAIVSGILEEVNRGDAREVRLLYGYYDCENIADPEGEDAETVDTSRRFEKELFGAYYAACGKAGSRFLREWSAFDRNLRNVSAAVTARAAGRAVEEVVVGGGDVAEQLQRSSAADFGLRGELPYIDAVIAAVNDEANLVEKEHKIDLIRWNEAVELATFDYFDVNAILSYLVRINIVARWTLLDAARGREMFARLLAELDGKELINKE